MQRRGSSCGPPARAEDRKRALGVLVRAPSASASGIPLGRLDGPRGLRKLRPSPVPPPESVISERPCEGAQRDRDHLLPSTEAQRHPGGTPGHHSKGEVAPPWRRAPQSPSALGESRRDLGLRLNPRPPQLSQAVAGQEVGGRGRGRCLGRGEVPDECSGPAPAPPGRGRAPCAPSAPEPLSRGVIESQRRAWGLRAGRTKRRRRGRPRPGTRGASDPTGPLSRAGQERRRPRGARSAECGARRRGSGSAAATGCVEPGPGPAGTCVCEAGRSGALPVARPAAARGRERRPERSPRRRRRKRRGRAAAQRGTWGSPREAPPRS